MRVDIRNGAEQSIISPPLPRHSLSVLVLSLKGGRSFGGGCCDGT